MTTATVTNATSTYDATRRQGDTGDAIVAVLYDSAGAPLVLTGSTVTLSMRNQLTRAEVIVAAAVTVTNALTGAVSYPLGALDTANSGIFEFEFIVTTGGGVKTTYPNGRFLLMNILPAI